MIRTIIVSNNEENIAQLKRLCKTRCHSVEIYGVGRTIDELNELMEQAQPQLVLLEVDLLPIGEVGPLENFEKTSFDVIFIGQAENVSKVTFSAIAYLTTPIQIKYLEEAINKIADKLGVEQKRHKIEDYEIKKIGLPTMSGLLFVNRDHIIRCTAQGNYTRFCLDNGEDDILITRTLKYYDDMLSSQQFFRIHKSNLVNLRHVKRFIRGKQPTVEMSDGQILEVSKRHREALVDRLMRLK